jgi:RNA polymerase sigma factor (sigma-70 family)
MLGSVHDAEDAVQHAFIAAHADLQRRVDREIHFKAWIYTIARNRCLSMLRARHDEPDADLEIVTDRLTDDVQQRADLRELLADVSKLPEDQREALVLSEVGALSHAEVADVIGCEVSKVKSLVFQARTALIDRRVARETSCEDIREQLATLRGGALRRSHLRHHLEACPGCTLYRDQIRRQRQMLALALPVLPSAGLRGEILSALGIGGGGAAAAGSAGIGGGLGLAAKSGLAKVGIAALVAGGATGTAAVVHNGGLPGLSISSPAQDRGTGSGPSETAAGASTAGGAGGSAGQSGSGSPGSTGADKNGPADGSKGTRSASGTENGFTPVPGASNGASARDFAATRGNGRHTGVTKTRHTPTRTRGGRKTASHKPVRAKKTPARKVRTAPDASPTLETPKTQPKTGSAPKTQAAPKTETAPAPTADPAPAAPTAGAGGALGTRGNRVADQLAAG